ncbi:NAD(+)/NADH kinase [Candidatus Curtissbacteria bacterium]|nr:NAD(+)/NADH kinase [Candidatus Curtissbacteria bacterium]
MKFGIVYKEEKEAAGKSAKTAKDFAKRATEFLKKKGHEVLGEKDLKASEVIVTFGGDGTLIHKACEYAPLGVPFVGINTGRVGFLTTAEAGDWQKALEKLSRGEYLISKRMTIEASLSRRTTNDKRLTTFRAVNEVVIKGLYRVVDLEVNVGDEKLLRVLGDGVILSTQTGSTAYSLSAGGPIVDPNLDSILVTPINPIGLPIPSVVLSPDDQILIKALKGDDMSLIIDGQEHTKLSEGEEVRVNKGKYNVKFGYFSKNHFLHALNAKFGLAGRVGS